MEAVTGDLNGDGKPDLVVTFSDSVDAGGRRLLVLMGNGDGSFATPITMDLGQSFLLVAAVDVNGDQKADLIITAPFKGDSFVLLGNGDGTFQPPRMIGSGVLRVADFNGDGGIRRSFDRAGRRAAFGSRTPFRGPTRVRYHVRRIDLSRRSSRRPRFPNRQPRSRAWPQGCFIVRLPQNARLWR